MNPATETQVNLIVQLIKATYPERELEISSVTNVHDVSFFHLKISDLHLIMTEDMTWIKVKKYIDNINAKDACVICLDDEHARVNNICDTCHARTCINCFIKQILTNDVYMCPICRGSERPTNTIKIKIILIISSVITIPHEFRLEIFRKIDNPFYRQIITDFYLQNRQFFEEQMARSGF